MDKFHKFLTELSARDTIMGGYYCFTLIFLFLMILGKLQIDIIKINV